MTAAPPLLVAHGLTKEFALGGRLPWRPRRVVRALGGVDLQLDVGETFAVVGESGCGKTTLGRALVRLVEPTSGSVRFRGEDLLALAGSDLRRSRRHFQMIFQDPYASLNPRLRIGAAIFEPLLVHRLATRAERESRVRAGLAEVGLPEDAGDRFPHELSGGQRQRVVIARAIATRPAFVVADEPVSALDVSVRAQVLNLLSDLQARHGLTMLLISHDLAVVDRIADRVAVMYLGRIVEEGACRDILRSPRHPYTVALRSAVPTVDPDGRRLRLLLPGEPPSPESIPSGCAFHPRCPIARDICRRERPGLEERAGPGRVACHFPGELGATGLGSR